MNELIEKLLQPVSGDNPCGEDLSSDPAYLALETMMRGKPETEFSPAEPPNWKEIRKRCGDLWKRSKDLRLAVGLTVSQLELEGFTGFADGLALLNGLVGTYWNNLYPRLSAEDGNDPVERMNIISGLAAPQGTYMDTLRVIERLRKWPLTGSSKMGRFSAGDILRSKAGKSGPDGKAPSSVSEIGAAFADTKPEELDQLGRTLTAARESVETLEDSLTKAVGANQSVSLEVLKNELKAICGLLPNTASEASTVAEASSSGAEGGTGNEPPRASGTGEIRSRKDVIAMLDKMCRYYSANEPSSPVPFLLNRAKRLAEKDFMQIINDLSPEALQAIQKITGEETKPEAPAGS